MRLALSQVGMEKPGLLMNLATSFLTADGARTQEILECTDLYERSEKLLILLKEEIELSRLQQDIQKQIEENQKEGAKNEPPSFLKKHSTWGNMKSISPNHKINPPT